MVGAAGVRIAAANPSGRSLVQGPMSRPDPRPEAARKGPMHAGAGGPALTCRDVIGFLLEYLEATLDDDTVALFERHSRTAHPAVPISGPTTGAGGSAGEVSRVEMPSEMRDRLRELLLGRLGSGPRSPPRETRRSRRRSRLPRPSSPAIPTSANAGGSSCLLATGHAQPDRRTR